MLITSNNLFYIVTVLHLSTLFCPSEKSDFCVRNDVRGSGVKNVWKKYEGGSRSSWNRQKHTKGGGGGSKLVEFEYTYFLNDTHNRTCCHKSTNAMFKLSYLLCHISKSLIFEVFSFWALAYYLKQVILVYTLYSNKNWHSLDLLTGQQ